MAVSQKVVVIGGVAAGPKAAVKIKRLDQDAEVTMIEKGHFLSYAGCGLPYYVGNDIRHQKELYLMGYGIPRDPEFFAAVKGVNVRNHTEALKIDRHEKKVLLREPDGKKTWIDYDKLLLCTGANPVIPPIPGVDLKHVHTLHSIPDAEAVKNLATSKKEGNAVIIGGGLIGVETAEALSHQGWHVTIVEMLPQVLSMLDWEMAKLVENRMKDNGVTILTQTRVTALEGEKAVERVVTDKGELPADLVILAVGVRPNVKLAREAGLALGPLGGIKVNERMQTSDDSIYAAGDCVENVHLMTGEPIYAPQGSTANKQGRVAAINICGGHDTFPGVMGAMVCKMFDYSAGRTGLNAEEARKQGFDVITVLVPAADKAHYMPNVRGVTLKLVVDKKTRRLLGTNAVGTGAVSQRIDQVTLAIMANLTVDEIAEVDLCYAPPFASAMDNLIIAANVARNKLDGYLKAITPIEVQQKREAGEDFILLDLRTKGEFRMRRIPGAINIPLQELRKRVEELDPNRNYILSCAASRRAYEASLILRHAGFQNVIVMDGGISCWPYEVETGKPEN